MVSPLTPVFLEISPRELLLASFVIGLDPVATTGFILVFYCGYVKGSYKLNDAPSAQDSSKSTLVAAGGLIAAVLASSCCIVPLLLVMLGVSGAWIGSLRALEAYQPIFVAITLGFLTFGFWQVYFKTKPDCTDDASCSRPLPNVLVKTVLWVATVLVVLTLTIDYWAPLFY
jgi:mercuric ion transport protein